MLAGAINIIAQCDNTQLDASLDHSAKSLDQFGASVEPANHALERMEAQAERTAVSASKLMRAEKVLGKSLEGVGAAVGTQNALLGAGISVMGSGMVGISKLTKSYGALKTMIAATNVTRVAELALMGPWGWAILAGAAALGVATAAYVSHGKTSKMLEDNLGKEKTAEQKHEEELKKQEQALDNWKISVVRCFGLAGEASNSNLKTILTNSKKLDRALADQTTKLNEIWHRETEARKKAEQEAKDLHNKIDTFGMTDEQKARHDMAKDNVPKDVQDTVIAKMRALKKLTDAQKEADAVFEEDKELLEDIVHEHERLVQEGKKLCELPYDVATQKIRALDEALKSKAITPEQYAREKKAVLKEEDKKTNPELHETTAYKLKDMEEELARVRAEFQKAGIAGDELDIALDKIAHKGLGSFAQTASSEIRSYIDDVDFLAKGMSKAGASAAELQHAMDQFAKSKLNIVEGPERMYRAFAESKKVLDEMLKHPIGQGGITQSEHDKTLEKMLPPEVESLIQSGKTQAEKNKEILAEIQMGISTGALTDKQAEAALKGLAKQESKKKEPSFAGAHAVGSQDAYHDLINVFYGKQSKDEEIVATLKMIHTELAKQTKQGTGNSMVVHQPI